MGWFSNYFDQDFHGAHKEGDEYTTNIEHDVLAPAGPYGEMVLSVYRVRGGKRGRKPLSVEKRPVNYGGASRVERELEHLSDEIVLKYTGVHDS